MSKPGFKLVSGVLPLSKVCTSDGNPSTETHPWELWLDIRYPVFDGVEPDECLGGAWCKYYRGETKEALMLYLATNRQRLLRETACITIIAPDGSKDRHWNLMNRDRAADQLLNSLELPPRRRMLGLLPPRAA